ncbi:MAG: hypothetical protein A2Z98_16645 [Spirochaetes bacterium GWB1_27_13]|nr:MAG: hypothetical protein A2Z98_16645 [Spirochaetes bacterium GWB1_27_13]
MILLNFGNCKLLDKAVVVIKPDNSINLFTRKSLQIIKIHLRFQFQCSFCCFFYIFFIYRMQIFLNYKVYKI